MGKATPLRLALLCILSLILGFKLYSWNANSLTGDSMPMPFGFGISVVLSGSMKPALEVNDLVFIRETKEIIPGNVIVYESDGELVIHRVISVDGTTVTTKGDANNIADEPFDLSRVKGKMVFYLPFIGAVFRAIKTPLGTFGVLLAAVLLVELSFRRDRLRDEEELEGIRREIISFSGKK
jgi:signal peptidase